MFRLPKNLYAPARLAAAAFCVLTIVQSRLPADVPAAISASVDAAAQVELTKQHVPGFALAVVKNGEVVKSAGYGMANMEQGTRVTPQTVFRISSLSKQFLATGVVLLAREGKLKLDDKVSDYLEGTPECWKEITLRRLLSHTSGLARECPAFDAWKPVSDWVAVQSAFALPLNSPTGSKYEYSNIGYFTLAEIISRRAGKPWPEFIQDRIFKPAGMEASRVTSVTDIIPRRAQGYEWKDGKWRNVPDQFAVRPSGAFFSTVLDMAKWEADLIAAKTLTAAEQEEMRTPAKLTDGKSASYGLGWQVGDFKGRRSASHGGANPGFRSHYLRLLDERLAVIVLTNGDGANPKVIAERVAALYLPAEEVVEKK